MSDYVRILQVIETTNARRGAGTKEDPIRIVTQYWSLDGDLLAEAEYNPQIHGRRLDPMLAMQKADWGAEK